MSFPDDWYRTQLLRIVSKIGSGATPTGGASAYLATRSEWALIRSQNVFDTYFSHDGLAFISSEQAYRLRSARVEQGDVLLNITGDGITFGRACRAPVDALPACVNQHVAIIRPVPSELDSDFLLAYITHPQVKSYIESFNAGGSRRAITKGHIESFVIPQPPLWEQQAIGRTLGALDDKIESNRRLNQNLESIVAALFKSSFVSFDPQYSGAPTMTAPEGTFPARYPENLVSEGARPPGWRVQPLGSVMANQRRGVEPSALDPDTPYVGLEHMPRGSIALSEWGRVADVASTKVQFRQGEILFGKLRPYFHKVGVAPVDGVASSDIVVISAAPEWFGFVLGHVSSERFVRTVNAASTGTKMPRASWLDMANYPVALPPVALASKYSALIEPMLHRIRSNIFESRTLSELRDFLLPKLLSGQVRVRDAERLMEAVV